MLLPNMLTYDGDYYFCCCLRSILVGAHCCWATVKKPLLLLAAAARACLVRQVEVVAELTTTLLNISDIYVSDNNTF